MVTNTVEDHSVPSPPHSLDSFPGRRSCASTGWWGDCPLFCHSLACLLPAITLVYSQREGEGESTDYISQDSQPLPLGLVNGRYSQAIGGQEEERSQVFLPLSQPWVASPKAVTFPVWSQLLRDRLHLNFSLSPGDMASGIRSITSS